MAYGSVGEVRVSIPGVREDALRTAGRACAEEDSGKESLHGEWPVPVRLVNAVAVVSSSECCTALRYDANACC